MYCPRLPRAVHSQGHSPLRGDDITVYLHFDGDTIAEKEVGEQGCSMSQSLDSMMTRAVKGKSLDEVWTLVRRFKAMLSIDTDDETPMSALSLGDLEAQQGVVNSPARFKCAVLAWNVLVDAVRLT